MKYLGVKLIEAEPMTDRQFRFNRVIVDRTPQDVPSLEDEKEGYKVTYEDGYISWSPKEVFEKAYRLTSGLTFGLAVEAMKKGLPVEREGWNGKGMVLQAQFPDEHSKMTFPYLYMTIPDCLEGIRKLPWQPAQVDIFSEDWRVVK